MAKERVIDAANEEWRHKRLEIAVKSKEKFKRELIAENERLSERLNELQALFPLREIPVPKNNVGEDEWRQMGMETEELIQAANEIREICDKMGRNQNVKNGRCRGVAGRGDWEIFLVYESSCVYRITDSRMEVKNTYGEWGDTTGHTLYDLLKGKSRIIKKPWKPKIGEEFFVCTQGYYVRQERWNNCTADLMTYAVGNCFRTREEAEAHCKEILERLQKTYDEGKPLIGADE